MKRTQESPIWTLCLLAAVLLSWAAVPATTQADEEEAMPETPAAASEERRAEIASQLGLEAEKLADLDVRPLYTFEEGEVHVYLAYLQEAIPDLRERVVYLGRKNLGQPYSLHLLGEFPFETYDPLPLYNLEQSDCVVFAEHTLAMALSDDWPSFFTMLQRIRYQNGRIGVVTRNHYTESDWNANNSWLVEDMSAQLAGEDVVHMRQTIRRSNFLANRYDLERDIPDRVWNDVYVPHQRVPEIEDQLEDGDLVNVMVGRNASSAYATHVGMIVHGEDGTVNFLHSTRPRVREESFSDYIGRYVDSEERRLEENRPILYGFKFLRLREDPLQTLREIDGPAAPVVSYTPDAEFVIPEEDIVED